jgi:putative aldouronate transport system substrate-binding protein
MDSRISRRSLVSRASTIGAGAALGLPMLARAQATPSASPAAGDPEAAAAAGALIQDLQSGDNGTIKVLSAVTGGKTPEEDKLFADEVKRLTNIGFDLVHPTAEYDQKLLADLAAGVEYDLIYIGLDTMFDLADQGVLTSITDKVEGSALLSNPSVVPPEEWDSIRYNDEIYGVFNKKEGARMPIVRQDWMEKLGLEEPKTLDDFYNVMVAFRDEDPDGNGKADTYGLSTSKTYDIQPFLSAQGIKPGYVEVDGARTIPWATEDAIPVYEWLAKLYSEGLYDPNFATNATSDMRNLFLTDRVGIVTYWDTWVGLFNNLVLAENPDTEFVAKGIPGAVGPDGNIIIERGLPGLWSIPVNSKNPDTAFKWTEWWNTIPGITLGTLGILDHDYTVTDGKYALTDIGKEHGMDHGDPTPYNTNWHNPIGTLPGLEDAQQVSAKYAYLPTHGLAWGTDVQPILDEFIIQAIQGDISPEDAITGMQDQLRSKDLID